MKLIVADDHALFREGLLHILQPLGSGLNIVEAANVDDLMLLTAEHANADLLLIDLYMPGKNSFEAIQTLSVLYPTLPIIVLSASNNPTDMQKAIDLGAMGYINKDSSSNVMLSAIRLVLAGERYIPAKMMQPHEDAAAQLTPRQKEVLKLMANGLSNKLIAAELCISEPTVKMHISSIFRFLDVTNRTQAVLKVNEMQIKSNF